MDTEWTEYQCKSGQTLFIYNKVTGEHKWPTQYGSMEDNIKYGQPIIYKGFCSTATQTDDYGCSNGCTSMYIDTDSTNVTHRKVYSQPSILGPSEDHSIHILDGNVLKVCCKQEPTPDMDGDSSMSSILAQLNFPSENVVDVVEKSSHVADSSTDNISLDISDLPSEAFVDVVGKSSQVTDDISLDISDLPSETFVDVVGKSSQVTDDISLDISDLPSEKLLSENCSEPTVSPNGAAINLNLNESEEKCVLENQEKGVNTLVDTEVIHDATSADGFSVRNQTPFKSHQEFPQTQNAQTPFQTQTGEKVWGRSHSDNPYLHRKSHAACLEAQCKEKPYICSYCDQSFWRKSILTSHIRIHTRDQLHPCFNTRSNEYRVDYKPSYRCRKRAAEEHYRCPTCDMDFLQKGQLSVHIRSHEQEKLYKCSHCVRECSTKQELTVHLQRHTEEKAYSCAHCDKKFHQKCHYTFHLLTHVRETPTNAPVVL